MLTIFDEERPLSDEEMADVRQYAAERIAVWRMRSLYSIVALLLSCASVISFSKGHDLHAYAEPLEDCWFTCRWPCWSCSFCARDSGIARGKLSATWRKGNCSARLSSQ
jgi:hypothetical protein